MRIENNFHDYGIRLLLSSNCCNIHIRWLPWSYRLIVVPYLYWVSIFMVIGARYVGYSIFHHLPLILKFTHAKFQQQPDETEKLAEGKKVCLFVFYSVFAISFIWYKSCNISHRRSLCIFFFSLCFCFFYKFSKRKIWSHLILNKSKN